MDTNNTINPTSNPTNNPNNVNMNEDSSNQNLINPTVVIEKKKRGRKKTIKPDVVLSNSSNDETVTTVTEKKIRKRRTKKNMIAANDANHANDATDATDGNEANVKADVVSGVKVRKRRVCKSKNIDPNSQINMDTNVIIDSNNPDTHIHPIEEKVVKKRGRKPKGGKIITQKLEENNDNNEIPNIILHLKCSLNDIKNKNSEKSNYGGVEESQIESYNNSSQLKGSDIFIKNNQPIMESKNLPSTAAPVHAYAYNDSLSHLFKVYNPDIPSTASTSSDMNMNKNSNASIINSNTNANANTNTSISCCSSNEILNNRTGLFNGVYSPDINLYSNNDYDEGDDGDSITGTCKNEKEIWRKINQLKISFHKSDICKNIGGTQRSACFWCTCEFDSPAIYIPKSLTKDVYNVYGCFCSPECSAAFLMNENVDTSTKFSCFLNSEFDPPIG
jgi:hypothetical protein